MVNLALVATPLPASPTRGEVRRGHRLASAGTLPLVGRDGEGEAPDAIGRGDLR
jgi:hypothetical protein